MWGFTSEFSILFAKIDVGKNCIRTFGFDIAIILIFYWISDT